MVWLPWPDDLGQDLVILEQRHRDELAEQALVGGLQHVPRRLAAAAISAGRTRRRSSGPCRALPSSARSRAPSGSAPAEARRRAWRRPRSASPTSSPRAWRCPRPSPDRSWQKVEPCTTARSMWLKILSKMLLRVSSAPTGTWPPDSDFASSTMSGSTFQCSTARKRPVRPMPVWISSATNSVPYLLAERGRARQELVGGHVDALALDRLDDEGRDLARGQRLSRARRDR